MIADERAWRDGDVRAVFDASPVAYLCVTTSTGPHVTPQIAAAAAGRLYFVTSERSLKVKAIRKRPGVAVTAWLPGSETAVVVHADALVLDGSRPVEIGRRGLEAVLGAFGLAKFAGENTGAVLGSVWDAATGRLRGGADPRVLVAVHPDRVTTVAVAPSADAVIGWLTPGGPLAVPGTWDEASGRISLTDEARELLVGRDSSPAAVSVDTSNGAGAAERSGTMFRGPGHLQGDGVEVTVERVTRWCGGRVETTAHL